MAPELDIIQLYSYCITGEGSDTGLHQETASAITTIIVLRIVRVNADLKLNCLCFSRTAFILS
jgi:hypothetical protein